MAEISDREVLEAALHDSAATKARIAVCESVAHDLQALGASLGVGGWLFRDDWLRGLSMLTQMAGELGSGAVTLLHAELHYPAAALVRQLVEVEYLVVAFDEDRELAHVWLNSTPDELRKMFSPATMRKRANGRFRDTEYWTHCQTDGHPHPVGSQLLPNHSNTVADNQWQRGDLAQHLDRVWRAVQAARSPDSWPSTGNEEAVLATLAAWHASDPWSRGVILPSKTP
jgi:hypothetical protein